MNKKFIVGMLVLLPGVSEASWSTTALKGLHTAKGVFVKGNKLLDTLLPIAGCLYDRELFGGQPDVDEADLTLIMQEAKNMGIKRFSLGEVKPEHICAKRHYMRGMENNAGATLNCILMSKFSHDDEARVVIRHELSHIKHYDALENILTRIGWSYKLDLAGHLLVKAYPTSRAAKIWSHWLAGSLIKTVLANFITNYIHSKREARADREAIDSPAMRDAMIAFLKKGHAEMNEKVFGGKYINKLPNWFYPLVAAHPSLDDRIAQAQRMFPEPA